ncbi:MAG: hypothetical protein GY754_20530, partial [bacterium]|nr:hypothetical protein [bacterium]
MTSQNRTNINDSGNFPNSEFASGAISFDDMSLDDLFDELDWPDDNTVPRPSGESARVPGPPRIGRIDIGARIDIAGLSKPPDPVAAPDSSSDISSLEKNLLDAQKEYYRRVVREEDKLILKKLFTNKKSLGPHEKKIFKKINFEHQKLFHIWNVEESLLACLEYKDLSRDDHRCVRDSCKDIISDFESNASQYEKLILGLAARGVSSSYHLFQGLFLHAT